MIDAIMSPEGRKKQEGEKVLKAFGKLLNNRKGFSFEM